MLSPRVREARYTRCTLPRLQKLMMMMAMMKTHQEAAWQQLRQQRASVGV